MDDSMKNIGEEIRKNRIFNNFTQKEFGKEMGYSEKSISAWENGRRKPVDEAFEKMKSLFHVDPRLSHKNQMEDKKMCLAIKPLEELNTEKDVEEAINNILGELSLQTENQFVINYILKRILFVGVGASLGYNRMSRIEGFSSTNEHSWECAIEHISDEVLLNNRILEQGQGFADCSSAAVVLRRVVQSKFKMLEGYIFGPEVNWKEDDDEIYLSKIPLKGDDRDIAYRGYISYVELMDVLPLNDNSIITSILVYLRVIRTEFFGMEV